MRFPERGLEPTGQGTPVGRILAAIECGRTRVRPGTDPVRGRCRDGLNPVKCTRWTVLMQLGRSRAAVGLAVLLCVHPSVAQTNPTWATRFGDTNAFGWCQRIGRGVNLGNALEAPSEGQWGVTIKEQYLDDIRAAGFDSGRLPVCWSAHALGRAPFTLSAKFLERVDQVVTQAAGRGFVVILTMHHYNELYADPAAHKERFLAIWRQLAEHYKGCPPCLILEPLNEPHQNLTAAAWNGLLQEVLRVIRQSNPSRTVVLGPVNYNDVRQLNTLELPESDRNLIATFHYYLPYEFTHQGAHWAPGSRAWLGRKWTGSEAERRAVDADFETAAAWSRAHGRPVFLGEFGAISQADMDSRVRWTRFLADTAVTRQVSFTYWDFCAGYFGLYEPQRARWHTNLTAAVLGRSTR